MQLSQRVKQLAPSPTLAITALAKSLKQQGKDVIGLGAGEPDFNTPQHIRDAAIQAMQEGRTKYTAAGGIPELKDAIRQKFQRDHKLIYERNQIMVSVGAKEALYDLFQVILDPGDEVIIPTPYWVSYIEHVKLAGGIPVLVEGKESHSFKITPEQLREAITDRTKAIILNSPSNPTGMVYDVDELKALGQVAIEHDILIVSDEIYEHLVYDADQIPASIASLGPKFYERTVVINGVSKTYAMTGWRIGWAAGPKAIIQAMTDLSSHSISNPSSIAQYAAVAALMGPQEPVAEMKQAFHKRRDYVLERIKQIPGFRCLKPQGAFYAFINIQEVLKQNTSFKDVNEWCKALLEDALVAVVPGTAFGSPDHIRISYATSMEQLEKAFDRIHWFVKK